MTIAVLLQRHRSVSVAILLAAMAAAVTGCTSELASIDDVYVPESIEENYPIKVVERPIRVSFDAGRSGLQPADAEQVNGLGRQAASRTASPVTISFASASRSGRKAADQIAAILTHRGVPKSNIRLRPVDGKSDVVTLNFATTVAVTKPCGDWSQNMRANQYNGVGPNFGCAFQQNLAASVTTPEDLVHPRKMTPAPSAAFDQPLTDYQKGVWSDVVNNTGISEGN